MDESVKLVQLPCKVCQRPIEVEESKAKEYEKSNTLPLCLEHAIEANPQDF